MLVTFTENELNKDMVGILSMTCRMHIPDFVENEKMVMQAIRHYFIIKHGEVTITSIITYNGHTWNPEHGDHLNAFLKKHATQR